MAARVAEYAEPTLPLGRDVVVITRGGIAPAMLNERAFVAVCAGELESLT